MAGVHIAHHDVEAFGKKIVFNILVHMEVPDEVQHQDILGDLVDGGGGLVLGDGLEHIRPDHHFEVFGGQIAMKAVNIAGKEVCRVFLAALGANTDAVDLVMTHVDILPGLENGNDLVHQVKNQLIGFFVGGAVVVGVEFVGSNVLLPGIHLVGVIPGSILCQLCDLRMGNGQVLDMTKALNLGNHIDAQSAAVFHQIPGFLLCNELSVSNAAVGEGRPDAFPAFFDGLYIGFIDLRMTLKLHAGRNLHDDKIVAHGGEDVFDHPFEEGDILPGGDHQVSTPPGISRGIGDLANRQLMILQQFADGLCTIDKAPEIGCPEGNGMLCYRNCTAVNGNSAVPGNAEGCILCRGNDDAHFLSKELCGGFALRAVPEDLGQQLCGSKASPECGIGRGGEQLRKGSLAAQHLQLFQLYAGKLTGKLQSEGVGNIAGIQKQLSAGKDAAGFGSVASQKLIPGIKGDLGQLCFGAEIHGDPVDEKCLAEGQLQAKIRIHHLGEIHLQKLTGQGIAVFGQLGRYTGNL